MKLQSSVLRLLRVQQAATPTPPLCPFLMAVRGADSRMAGWLCSGTRPERRHPRPWASVARAGCLGAPGLAWAQSHVTATPHVHGL